jgi:hypothetical protein
VHCDRLPQGALSEVPRTSTPPRTSSRSKRSPGALPYRKPIVEALSGGGTPASRSRVRPLPRVLRGLRRVEFSALGTAFTRVRARRGAQACGRPPAGPRRARANVGSSPRPTRPECPQCLPDRRRDRGSSLLRHSSFAGARAPGIGEAIRPELLELGSDHRVCLGRADSVRLVDDLQSPEPVQSPELAIGGELPLAGLGPPGHLTLTVPAVIRALRVTRTCTARARGRILRRLRGRPASPGVGLFLRGRGRGRGRRGAALPTATAGAETA